MVLDPGSPSELTFVLVDRLFVGRECAGIDDSRRIVLSEDLSVSRNHLEIRVDVETSQAAVVDTSSNGSRVNGVRIERSVSIPISDGDLIQVGERQLAFRLVAAPVVRGAEHRGGGATVSIGRPQVMAMVVGDLINFSTVSESADHTVLARDVDMLYSELRRLLSEHRGTLIDYVGDAFFACWELDVDSDAADHALQFALAAAERVAQTAATLELRYADGSPLRMGWALAMGSVMMRLMPGAVTMALGDAVNVGFRIASISGREGRPSILANQTVKDAAHAEYVFGEPETVSVKGRVGTETIYGVERL